MCASDSLLESAQHIDSDCLEAAAARPAVRLAAALCCLAMFVSAVAVTGSVLHAAARKVPTAPSLNDTLVFLVIGDWGRQGAYNGMELGQSLGRVANETGVQRLRSRFLAGAELQSLSCPALPGASFILSVGDNVYENGLAHEWDSLFEQARVREAPSRLS